MHVKLQNVFTIRMECQLANVPPDLVMMEIFAPRILAILQPENANTSLKNLPYALIAKKISIAKLGE